MRPIRDRTHRRAGALDERRRTGPWCKSPFQILTGTPRPERVTWSARAADHGARDEVG